VRESSRHASGFSLLEVLVASAVLAIVMAVLLGTLTTSLNLWRTTESKLSADREARAGELLMAQDLANVVVPANPELWPRVQQEKLQFLTLKPRDYQAGANDVGDVCFVEYSVNGQDNTLRRRFLGSEQTFNDILNRPTPAFPSPGGPDAQVLATSLLPEMSDAVRGMALQGEAPRDHFVVLNRRLIPQTAGDADPPAAIEVNFAVADPNAMANKDLWSNPNYKLRNAGLYSFRVHLPEPSSP
jgi:prepilin-type N-terminal cleavage/methylation domain-containing protein